MADRLFQVLGTLCEWLDGLRLGMDLNGPKYGPIGCPWMPYVILRPVQMVGVRLKLTVSYSSAEHRFALRSGARVPCSMSGCAMRCQAADMAMV